MPYGIYDFIHKRRNKNFFLDEFDKYISSNHDMKTYMTNSDVNENYKQIVSVQGLGYSGSGAILDLLCEVDKCNVLGKDEKAIVLGNDHKGAFEVDFLRLAGGIFELEKYIDSDNVFQNDAMANRFISCVNAFPLFQKDKKVRDFFYAFFSSIIDLKISNVVGVPFNPYLYNNRDSSHIFFFKKMETPHFRHHCRILLMKLFSYLNTENKDILVLDQFLQDNTLEIEKYKDYAPSSRIILCYRDPRDVYQFACDYNIGWIAHNDVNQFVKWYRQMTRNVNLNTNDYLVVQFEKLVFDYERQVERILSYLNINKEAHNPLLKLKFFNPNISKQNIGLWKNNIKKQVDYEFIKEQLRIFCYFETN